MNSLVIGIIVVIGFLTAVILFGIYTEEKPERIHIIKDFVNTTQNQLSETWTFVPIRYDTGACRGSDCPWIANDEKCGTGYWIKQNGKIVRMEEGIKLKTGSVTLDYSKCNPELSKRIWVETYPVSCIREICDISKISNFYNTTNYQTITNTNLTGVDQENYKRLVKDFLGKYRITVYDIKIEFVESSGIGEYAEEWDKYKLSIIVSGLDLDRVYDQGFKVSENQTSK